MKKKDLRLSDLVILEILEADMIVGEREGRVKLDIKLAKKKLYN